jgi:hypothetical protein
MRQQVPETSFAFKRIEDYQLQRASVGLEVIPEKELVIGILNRLDISRYDSYHFAGAFTADRHALLSSFKGKDLEQNW